MKKIFVVIVLSFFSFAADAQHVFEKSDLMFNVGIGLFSYDGLIPSINVSGEYGSIPTGDVGLVSFGGILAYKYSTYDWVTGDNYHYNQFTFGARGTWQLHIFESDKGDAYGGAGFGIRLWQDYVWNYDSNRLERKGKATPYGEIYVGGRMMFNEKFGLFSELGYGTLSAIKFGITFTL